MVTSPFEYYAFPHRTTYLPTSGERILYPLNDLEWSSIRYTGVIDEAPRQQQIAVAISQRPGDIAFDVTIAPLTPDAILHADGRVGLDGILARTERWYLPAVLSELARDLGCFGICGTRYVRSRNPDVIRASIYQPRGRWIAHPRGPPDQYPSATLPAPDAYGTHLQTTGPVPSARIAEWFDRLPPIFGPEINVTIKGKNIPAAYQSLRFIREETHGASILQGTTRYRQCRLALENRLRAKPLPDEKIGDRLGLSAATVSDRVSSAYSILRSHPHRIRAIHDALGEPYGQ